MKNSKLLLFSSVALIVTSLFYSIDVQAEDAAECLNIQQVKRDNGYVWYLARNACSNVPIKMFFPTPSGGGTTVISLQPGSSQRFATRGFISNYCVTTSQYSCL